MARLIDRIERLMFGATAQERVDLLMRYAEQRVQQRLAQEFAALTDADTAADTDATGQPDSGQPDGKDGGAA